MSAANVPRADGSLTERSKDDDYQTPAWCFHAIWPHVRPVTGQILEPCAGSGAIVRQLVRNWDYQSVHGRELDFNRYNELANLGLQHLVLGDWLAHDEKLRPSLIITNPPYSLAFEFVQKAWKVALPVGGTVAMLLRLGFLASQERSQWLVDHTPSVYVLSRRPSFTEYLRAKEGQPRCVGLVGKAKRSKATLKLVPPPRCDRRAGHVGDCMKVGTDSADYAWCVWGPLHSRGLHILPPPKEG